MQHMVVFDAHSLWVNPMFELILVSGLAVLLEIKDLRLACDAHNLSVVHIDENAVILNSLWLCMFLEV